MQADIVRFNIGGQHFDISRQLLYKFKDSLLVQNIESGNYVVDHEKRIFYDRNPLLFSYVMNYMRDTSSIKVSGLVGPLKKEFRDWNIDLNDCDDSSNNDKECSRDCK
jgi:hypothetical protein